ncbi:MAG: hypothetical protein JSS67_03910 [Bacteroidetes bacterium]|nr:hypothetical protein [Bacteroidota bacterium]
MKTFFLSLLFLGGCLPAQQNAQSNSQVNSNSSQTVNTNPAYTPGNTQFGVMFADISSAQDKLEILKQLRVKTTRMTLSMDTWNGQNSNLEALQNAGYKVLLNVYWKKIRNDDGTKTPQPFPTGSELDVYRTKLNDILSKYKPEVLLVENEELVLKFHSGDISNYLNMLKVAVDVAHSKGVKVSDGGITNPQISLLVYNYLLNQNQRDEANRFANSTMNTRILKFSQNQNMNSDIGKKLAQAQELVEGLKNINIDYVNLHWYEQMGTKASTSNNTNAVSTGQLGRAVDFLSKLTGKPVILGECGQVDADETLTSSMLQEIANTGVPYAIWLSSNNGTTKALNSGNSLLAAGNAFVKFMDTYQK